MAHMWFFALFTDLHIRIYRRLTNKGGIRNLDPVRQSSGLVLLPKLHLCSLHWSLALSMWHHHTATCIYTHHYGAFIHLQSSAAVLQKSPYMSSVPSGNPCAPAHVCHINAHTGGVVLPQARPFCASGCDATFAIHAMYSHSGKHKSVLRRSGHCSFIQSYSE